MDDQCDSMMTGSDSKFTGDKRSSAELGEKSEIARKRTKMRDLESVLRSQETNSRHVKGTEASDRFHFGEEMSQVINVPVTLDLEASQAERSGRTTLSVEVNPAPKPLDLNSEACNSASNDSAECAENSSQGSLHKMRDRKCDNKCASFGGIELDLNAEDVASSVNHDPFYPFKNHDHLKSKDASECGSTTGPVEDKDPLSVWKEMKQNGFLSSSHGGVSIQSGFLSSSHGGIPVPKQRWRKSKNDALKKKMELAQKEQVDRFTKIAAPSGLLNGLNPGIINHVRNKKQVHSIIEALVRSENLKNSRAESKLASHLKNGAKETCNKNDSGINRISFSRGFGSAIAPSGSNQKEGYPILSEKGDFRVVDRTCGGNSVSHSTAVDEDDTLALKLSSLTKASEESSTFSNEESTNITNVSLSARAATVASQWLELLHQDIKGRLSALRRSKKRVRAVITTELPFLMSKEFSSNQENDPNNVKISSDGLSNNATAAMHHARWSTLFDQMDRALSEEEKQLESWLNQLKEKQLHCDHGLQHFHWNAIFGVQQQETSENYNRPGKVDNSERELAIRAAAASIYSTCNFLMSKEDVSCF